MSQRSALTRRQFLKRSTLAAAGAMAAPFIIPSRALGADGAVAPSNRITLGLIGLGKLGRGSHLSAFLGNQGVQLVALCDVFGEKLDAARAKVEQKYAEDPGKGGGKGLLATKDFRELLAHSGVDAVCIATPDHWHAVLAVSAARAGKDIYLEKPMANSIGEARAVVQAVERYGRIMQVGSQQRSNTAFRHVCELVRNGRIGAVRQVFVNVGPPASECFVPAAPVPPSLDWEMWLGPAPWRPYTSELAPPLENTGWPQWRAYWDFGGGGMTDFGAHHFDIAQWGLGMDATGPVEITPPDGKEIKRLTYRYANGIEMFHGGGEEKAAVEFVGDKGRISVNRGEYMKSTPDGLIGENLAPGETHLCKSDDHHQDWIDCIKTRSQPICTAEIGCRSVTVCHLGNLAYRLNRPLKWNPAAERFVNDPEADRFLLRPMRAPWHI